MIKKSKTIRGKAAKKKGTRAELKVRNALRTIYPTENRDAVQRVPLSGAGAMKGDVMDMNDPLSCYEVKCCETLVLHDWWRQAKSQAGTARTPILVITQSYRPFYYIMRTKDWSEMVSRSIYSKFTDTVSFARARNLFDRLAELDSRTCAEIELDDDPVFIISESFYIEIKKDLYYTDK